MLKFGRTFDGSLFQTVGLYLSVMDIRDSFAGLLNMRCTRYVFMYKQLAEKWKQGAGDGTAEETYLVHYG